MMKKKKEGRTKRGKGGRCVFCSMCVCGRGMMCV